MDHSYTSTRGAAGHAGDAHNVTAPLQGADQACARRASRRADRARGLAVAGLAALAFLGFYRPPGPLLGGTRGPSARRVPSLSLAKLTEAAFGRSGAVRVRLTLPSETIAMPLSVAGDSIPLEYQWVRSADSGAIDTARVLTGASLATPATPGFYRLAVLRAAERQIIDGLTVGVMVPFEEKKGIALDGYRIGLFAAERRGAKSQERPEGFVKVSSADADLPISKHFRLSDFLTRDGQTSWPRYAAVSSRIIDKVELVVAELANLRGDTSENVLLDVHSAFRTPLYNRTVKRAASDSRHQYGDAMDVAIDADGDGKLTVKDIKLVARAVEIVEAQYPELVGGMGLYTSRRYPHPYVHIDARGSRARWRA